MKDFVVKELMPGFMKPKVFHTTLMFEKLKSILQFSPLGTHPSFEGTKTENIVHFLPFKGGDPTNSHLADYPTNTAMCIE